MRKMSDYLRLSDSPLVALSWSLIVVVTLAAIGYGARDAVGQRVAGVVAEELVSKRLEDLDGRQLAVTQVVYQPGASSMPHRHAAYLAVYVVAGQVESALDDEQPVLYGPGDAWVESHLQLHRVFRNPSSTEPFTVIVFALRDADHPANVQEPDGRGQ
jgi:quercetin dioxygenase-like cupin family protein